MAESPTSPCSVSSNRATTAAGIACLILLQPDAAHADAGVPMLALMAIPMWVSLLVIIPLEALIARRLIRSGWLDSLKLSSITNLMSTVVGVPLTWGLLLVLEFGTVNLAHSASTRLQAKAELLRALAEPLGFLMTTPWLFPVESQFYWSIPSAAILLLVPFCLASVWIEYLVGRRILSQASRPLVRRWAWQANLASYALLVLVPVVLLFQGLSHHHRVANDDEHRSVERVSPERLWGLAILRVEAARAPLRHPPVKSDSAETEGDLAKVIASERALAPSDRGKEYLQTIIRNADLLSERGQIESADSLYRVAITLGRTHSGYYLQDLLPRATARVARHRRLRGETAVAESILVAGIARAEEYRGGDEFPDSSASAPLLLERGLVFLDRRQLPQAEHCIKSAMRWSEQPGEAAMAYAQWLEAQGRRSDAAVWFARAANVPAGGK